MSSFPALYGPALPRMGNLPPEKLVIFCHGYGANGQDLIGLALNWQQDLPTVSFFSPDAPQKSPGMPGGFQWWDLGGFSPAEQEAGVNQAAPILNMFIDQTLDKAGLTEADLALVGFSQGTMLSLFVGLQRARPLAAIIGYSGAVAAPDLLASSIQSRPPVLLVHGDMDHMIPPTAMTASERFLKQNDVDVRTHISKGMGHGIAPDGIDLGRDFLLEAFGLTR
jgi:phospholipase/carboxylesterase